MSNNIKRFQPIPKEKEIINSKFLEKCWYLGDEKQFLKNYKEYYPPDIWFIGKNREFEHEMAENISKAKEMVIVVSFLLQDTEIIQAILKIAHKVRVYILTASENRLKDINEKDDGFEDAKVSDHISLLKTLKRKCLIRTAPNFHTKFILIDPINSHERRGYLSTANLTKHALSNNIEMGVKLNDNQIIDLFNLVCHAFWNVSQHEYLTKDSLRKTGKVTSVKKPKLNQVFSPNQNMDFETILLNALKNTTGDIFLSTFSISDDNEIFNQLIQVLSEGRKVTIFTRPRPKDIEVINNLKLKGAEIFGHKWLHLKALIITSSEENNSFIFTGNITEQSFKESFDVGIILNSKQKQTITKIFKDWAKMMPNTFIAKEKIENLSNGKYLQWVSDREVIEINEEQIIDLGEIEGSDIFNYHDFQPKLGIPEIDGKEYKKYIFKWILTPPKLPNNAKRLDELPDKLLDLFQEEKQKKVLKNTEVYKKGKNFYVVIDKEGDLDKIKMISDELNAKIVMKGKYDIKW